jgi:hypothetical protein
MLYCNELRIRIILNILPHIFSVNCFWECVVTYLEQRYIRVNYISSHLLTGLFAITLFLSASLLFVIQPMFAKMVLPVLGGAPSVWSVALVFFQLTLLAGYFYAHLLSRYIPLHIGLMIHGGVIALAFTMLPISVVAFERADTGNISLWLMSVFAASLGLPFFALAGNAPLLQSWFARSEAEHARDPYFLYGASNAGSFMALLAYPLVIEPYAALSTQTVGWMAGFGLLAACVALCGGATLAQDKSPISHIKAQAVLPAMVSWPMRLTWLAYSFVPSGLLVALTAYISTDIAAAPFLWVLPLALYLLTFVLAFRDGPPLHKALGRYLPILIAVQAGGVFFALHQHWELMLCVGLGLFFIAAMVCHGELYHARPDARDLTSFYLWVSLGGAFGGIFAALLAPLMFASVLEYPLLLIAALMCLPQFWRLPAPVWKWQILPLLAFAFALYQVVDSLNGNYRIGICLIAAGAMLLSWQMPARVAACMLVFMAAQSTFILNGKPVLSVRNFFGVHRVMDTEDGKYRMLFHGTTLHGAQRVKDDAGNSVTGKPGPLTYYSDGGPIADALFAARTVAGGVLNNVSIVGLGAGSLSCYREPGESWRFYEIDPDVVRIARDPNLFSFLSQCGPDTPVIMGDARLTLGQGGVKNNVLVVDAFSSDAIPVHLLTGEAMRLYLSRLSDHGMIVFHISNRHMDLSNVITATAAAQGLVTWTRMSRPASGELITPAFVAVVTRNDADVGELAGRFGWQKQFFTGEQSAWSDDYSNILGVLMHSKRAAH